MPVENYANTEISSLIHDSGTLETINKSFELTNQTPKAQTAENKRVKHVLPQFRKRKCLKSCRECTNVKTASVCVNMCVCVC